jgi:hypothetical protein
MGLRQRMASNHNLSSFTATQMIVHVKCNTKSGQGMRTATN